MSLNLPVAPLWWHSTLDQGGRPTHCARPVEKRKLVPCHCIKKILTQPRQSFHYHITELAGVCGCFIDLGKRCWGVGVCRASFADRPARHVNLGSQAWQGHVLRACAQLGKEAFGLSLLQVLVPKLGAEHCTTFVSQHKANFTLSRNCLSCLEPQDSYSLWKLDFTCHF